MHFPVKIVQRAYQPGDEIEINRLYKIVSGIGRTVSEFEWEWINTWNGRGFSRLAFDVDRQEGDQLIMQYSLISTPFSFWGKSYLAGKTENCMCHPDYRGQGLYFPHEKKYFEEAKHLFQLFFTTSGNATKGAPGAVRRKLGYISFDSWTKYVFCLSSRHLQKLFYAKLKGYGKIPDAVAIGLSAVASRILSTYFNVRFPRKPEADIRIFSKDDAPLDEIERFWNRIKPSYMITIDRQSSYLAWRINQNPHYDYKYLLYYQNSRLCGYMIFLINGDNACMITDILAENKEMAVFNTMISYLIWYAGKMGADAVICRTLAGNGVLKAAFAKNKFIDLFTLRKMIERKGHLGEFHVYLSPDIQSEQDPRDPGNWYVTDLVKEGQPG